MTSLSHHADKVAEPGHEKLSQEWREHDEAAVDPNIVALVASYVPGSEEEKRFVRRIDKRIIPTIWALYTLSYLDRANIGSVMRNMRESSSPQKRQNRRSRERLQLDVHAILDCPARLLRE